MFDARAIDTIMLPPAGRLKRANLGPECTADRGPSKLWPRVYLLGVAKAGVRRRKRRIHVLCGEKGQTGPERNTQGGQRL
eukprot:1386192-Rhodomonas_salina.1